MGNKKLLMFNIAILFTVVGIILIGSNTWGATNHLQDETVTADELIENEQAETIGTAEIPLLINNYEKKKQESDFDLFIQEDLEIIELEEAEETLEQDMEEEQWELEQTNDSETIEEPTNAISTQRSGNSSDIHTGGQRQQTGPDNRSTPKRNKTPTYNNSYQGSNENTNAISPEQDQNNSDENTDSPAKENNDPQKPDRSDESHADPKQQEHDNESENENDSEHP